ncbi:MAG: hypothetical protein KatS3mg109_1439 [Pirellulaceae bacterium]|nr:MAG: hypothetical protein KatS3mg109_1439 [Pirellulaceae bacterium]
MLINSVRDLFSGMTGRCNSKETVPTNRNRLRQGWSCLAVVAVAVSVLAGNGWTQDFVIPRPGPEHEKLKQLEGTWDVVSETEGMNFRGTMVWRMELGGLWLGSQFEGEADGVKFSGRGYDTYDPSKKKYVSVWIDSMSTRPALFEGNYDATGKVLTMEGEGPGVDGKPTRFRMTSEQVDANTIVHTMWIVAEDGSANPMFKMRYKRRP